MSKNTLFLFYLMCVWVLSSCQTSSNGQQKSKDNTIAVSSFQYDLNTSQKIYTLPAVLDEISGITFHPQHTEVIYAIQDELGKLYSYSLLQEKVIDEFTFGKSGDYEDVATDGKYFYVLKSNGDIFYFPFDHKNDKSNVQVIKNLLPKGEYESLAINPSNNTLHVLCKECKVDKSNGTLTGYIFQLGENGSFDTTYKTFSLDINSLKSWKSDIGKSIKPSAITYNAKTQEWFIISSIDKFLLVTDSDFKPKNLVSFQRRQFEQPEGLAINTKGELFISSEIGDSNSAALYQFKSEI